METESKLDGDHEISASSTRKPLVNGCLLLVLSFVCFAAIPVLFVFTMGMGMASGSSPAPGDTPLYDSSAIIGMIGLGLSVIIALGAGVGGLVMLITWFLNKNSQKSKTATP